MLNPVDRDELEFKVGSLIVGKFRVIRKLGAGAIGSVYEVEHSLTRHRRALKVLHARFREDQELLKRFLREATAAARIGSENVVETLDAGTTEGGAPWQLMELLQGHSLSEVLRWTPRLPIGDACALGQKLAQVERPSNLNPTIPPALEAVVMKMLCPLPAGRYATCRDAQRALRGMLTGDPQEAARTFIHRVNDEGANAKLEDTLMTPQRGNETVVLTPRSSRSGASTPLLSAYLASLPHGLESFPEVQQKGSIVQSFLEGVPIQKHLARLPDAVSELVKRPPMPSAWVSEVKAAALYLACADLCFPSPRAYLEFAYTANKKIIEGPLYSVLFRVLGVERFVKVVAGRWDQFHRGTALQVVHFERTEGRLRLDFPGTATPVLLAQIHGTAFRASVELAGAKNVSVTCEQSSPTAFDYVCRWEK